MTSTGLKGYDVWVRFTDAPGSILDPNNPTDKDKYLISDVDLGKFTDKEAPFTVTVPANAKGKWTNIRVYCSEYIKCEAKDMPYVNCAYPQAMVMKNAQDWES